GSANDTVDLAQDVFAFSHTHVYADNQPGNATYPIHVTVTDAHMLADSADAQIVVNNVAPAPTITGAPATSPEGSAITVGVNPNDPGTADTFTYAWQVTKNGVDFASGTDSTLQFTPDDNGAYHVSVTVTDKDGGVGSTSADITVTNVAPTAAFSNNGPKPER